MFDLERICFELIVERFVKVKIHGMRIPEANFKTGYKRGYLLRTFKTVKGQHSNAPNVDIWLVVACVMLYLLQSRLTDIRVVYYSQSYADTIYTCEASHATE